MRAKSDDNSHVREHGVLHDHLSLCYLCNRHRRNGDTSDRSFQTQPMLMLLLVCSQLLIHTATLTLAAGQHYLSDVGSL